MSLIVYNESRVQPASLMNETDLTGQSSPADPRFIAMLQERKKENQRSILTGFTLSTSFFSNSIFSEMSCQSD